MTFAERFSTAEIGERFRTHEAKAQVLDELTRELAARRAALAALEQEVTARTASCRALVTTSIYAQEDRP